MLKFKLTKDNNQYTITGTVGDKFFDIAVVKNPVAILDLMAATDNGILAQDDYKHLLRDAETCTINPCSLMDAYEEELQLLHYRLSNSFNASVK